jgi:hypothetical protein
MKNSTILLDVDIFDRLKKILFHQSINDSYDSINSINRKEKINISQLSESRIAHWQLRKLPY